MSNIEGQLNHEMALKSDANANQPQPQQNPEPNPPKDTDPVPVQEQTPQNPSVPVEGLVNPPKEMQDQVPENHLDNGGNENLNTQNQDNPSEDYVFNYFSSSTLYAISFQNSQKCRLAIGTMEFNDNNRIEILEMINHNVTMVRSEPQEYPSTKLMWGPNMSKNDLLASSSDCIRLFKFDENESKLKLLSSLYNKKSKFFGPLTSFDWNKQNDSILGTASLDTTCTIWDLNKSTIKTQLIAHDSQVYDISFSGDEHIFISSGADGSVRLFDLRTLDHSTIIYETQDRSPITKIAMNTLNNHLIAALSWEKSVIYIFDSRNSSVSLVELKLHKSPVTGMVWSPNVETQICSVSEDSNVIISFVNSETAGSSGNVRYEAPSEINNVAWCTTLPEWIGITFQKTVQLLRK